MRRTGDSSRRNLELRRRRALAPWAEGLEGRQLMTLPPIRVTSTADSGPGTLRDAINAVNADHFDSPSAPDIIEFQLTPPVGSSQATITLTSPLPPITNPVDINGYSQAGSSTNSVGVGFGPVDIQETDAAVLNVRLDAPTAIPSSQLPGLITVDAANTTISGLSITRFQGPAIALLPPPNSPNGSVGDNIWGNFIGVDGFDPNNNTARGSAVGNAEGILVESSNNRIGGTLPPDRNVIQGNLGDGVQLAMATGTGNLVEGNFILDNGANGVDIATSNNSVGEAIGAGPAGAGNVISGNGANGVAIIGPAASGNIVVNNEIGTNIGIAGVVPPVRGMSPRPNGADGVLIQDAPGNIVGGQLPNSRNVIAANSQDGVSIQNGPNQDATGNIVQGNYIGFNERGGVIALLPNRDGINISSAGNTIGGLTAAARNYIASNARNGITISSVALDTSNLTPVPIPNADPTGNFVAGNYIGTIGGADDYGNTLDGILINDANGNTIGGTVSGAQNVVSGNNDGVVITNDGADAYASTGNVVAGNNIGLMSDNTTPLPNAVDGVLINGAADNTIGGTVTAAANLLSGDNNGLHITGNGAAGNVVEGNFVGTDITGTIAARNSVDGILIDGGASGNTIGGTATGEGNTIAFNIGSGIAVASGTNDAILSNSIFGNDRIGIDLVAPGDPADGVTPNQTVPASGPNGLLNYPTLAYAASNGSQKTGIQGTFVGAPGETYLLQFFSSPTADRSGFGQGETYVGSTEVTLTGTNPDQFVSASFDAEVPVGLASGLSISATATVINTSGTAAYGSSSEFSNAVATIAVQVGFSATSYTVNQNAGTAAITVTRSGATGADQGTVTVDYAVGGGTAVAGTNYTAVPNGTLTFAPGVDSQTITIPLIDDPAVAPSTTLNITLSNPTGGPTITGANPVTLTIANTNVPEVQFNLAQYFVNENAGTATIVVTRNTGTGTASVHYATANDTATAGVDYTAVSGTLDFAAGQTSQTFTVPILDAYKVGGVTVATLTLSDATGASLGTQSSATLSIVDNDSPGTLQFNNVTYGAPATAGSALITVTRTGGLGGSVSVNYATGGGSAVPGRDYAPRSGTLTFGPGQGTKTFSIPILNHQLVGAYTVGLTLTAPTSGATLGPVAHATLSIAQSTIATPVRAGNTPGPVITNLQLQTNGQAITGIALSFNEALDAARAQNLENYGYYILSAGPDSAFGTGDDYSVAIASATYNPATFQVLITPVVPLPLGQIFSIGINTQASVPLQRGLTDAAGNLLDGAYNGHSGTPYQAEFGLGAHLQYFDGSGNHVALQLNRGGLMALQLAGNGNAEQLQIVGPVPGRSTLTGEVHGATRRASTTIPVIEGAGGVRIRLPRREFHIGRLDAAAVDAVLARHRRK